MDSACRMNRFCLFRRYAIHFLNRLKLRLGQLLGRLIPGLIEKLRNHVIHSWNSAEGDPGSTAFLLRLGLTTNVDSPPGQSGGKPHILPLSSNGQGKLFVGDDNLHTVLVLRHDDLGHLGGGQCTTSILCLVSDPMDNVDFFSAQFLNHRLDPHTPHPHTGPHRIHIGISRGHRNFCPASRLPGDSFYLDDLFVDLWNFLQKEFLQHPRVGTR